MISSRLVFLPVILACSAGFLQSPARAAGEWLPPETLQGLPVISGLPDAFILSDGSRVKSSEDWARRREEMKAMLLYYQYGRMPPRPDRVIQICSEQRPHESQLGTVESMTLEIDSVKKLAFRAVFYLPKHPGRRPVIIREEDRLGQRKDVTMFLEKGYLFIEYARHDLDPDRDRVMGTAQAAYPNHDWATLAVWAWCGMRLVDYLETRSDVDMTRIGITGHSRGGKMALLTAALDERISLVVPHQSGSGGAGCYRVLGPGAETLAQNDKPHWYHERIRWFGEKEERLPFDQHFLKALVAPRALLCTESVDDEFANPLGSLATTVAAQKVYEFLGAPEKNAIHFRRGGHSTETRDWVRILEFAEWQFFGRGSEDRGTFWSAPFDLPESYASANGPARDKTAVDAEVGRVLNAAITFVSVGSPGNEADRDHHGQGRYGSVGHEFQIAVNHVSNREYAEFLAAVATEGDPQGLYDPAMADAEDGIQRVTKESGFDYVVPPSSAATPVTHVTWFDAIRYCNWLHNGRPQGPLSPETTEDGAYTIQGDQVSPRHNRARYFLPSENEWYKAAYCDRSGAYHHFAPGESNRPVLDKPAPDRISPWGMAGFADRVWEWTESPVGMLHRAVRSGAWFLGNNKQSAGHFYCNPQMHYFSVGFRVARPVE